MSEMQKAGLSLDEELDFYASRLAATTGTTGTGEIVLASSPTIVKPTIADLTNVTHNHQNAAGGGRLSPASWMGGPASSLLTLGTCRCWYEVSNDYTSDGAACGQLTDQSAAANHATQGTAGNKPTFRRLGPNGLPCLEFVTNDQLDLGTNITDTTQEIFAVLLRTAATGTFQAAFKTNQYYLMIEDAGTANAWGIFPNSGGTTTYESVSLTTTNYHLLNVTITASNDIDLGRTGIFTNSTSGGAFASSGTSSIGAAGSASFPASMKLAALICFSAPLTAAQRAEINAYLRGRYHLP